MLKFKDLYYCPKYGVPNCAPLYIRLRRPCRNIFALSGATLVHVKKDQISLDFRVVGTGVANGHVPHQYFGTIVVKSKDLQCANVCTLCNANIWYLPTSLFGKAALFEV